MRKDYSNYLHSDNLMDKESLVTEVRQTLNRLEKKREGKNNTTVGSRSLC
jgi:hypothetical protein